MDVNSSIEDSGFDKLIENKFSQSEIDNNNEGVILAAKISYLNTFDLNEVLNDQLFDLNFQEKESGFQNPQF